MKKVLASLVCISFFFLSCKKSASSVSSNGSLSATINGVNQSFNNILLAKNTAMSGQYSLYFSGTNGTSATADELSITVDAYQAITPGTYTLGGSSLGTTLPDIGYDQAYAQGGVANLYTSDITGTYTTTVTITAISSTSVQGTFSGTVVSSSGNTTKTITNGKFNITFK